MKEIENEQKATDSYLLVESEENHTNINFLECGHFLLEDFSFIGTTSDGLLNCDCHKEIHLEIKCPYSKIESKSIENAIMDNDFFIETYKKFEKTHEYFNKVQYQL